MLSEYSLFSKKQVHKLIEDGLKFAILKNYLQQSVKCFIFINNG